MIFTDYWTQEDEAYAEENLSEFDRNKLRFIKFLKIHKPKPRVIKNHVFGAVLSAVRRRMLSRRIFYTALRKNLADHELEQYSVRAVKPLCWPHILVAFYDGSVKDIDISSEVDNGEIAFRGIHDPEVFPFVTTEKSKTCVTWHDSISIPAVKLYYKLPGVPAEWPDGTFPSVKLSRDQAFRLFMAGIGAWPGDFGWWRKSL